MVERGNGSEVRVTDVTRRVLEVVQAGVVPYVEALEWQRALAQARIERQVPHDLLLLLEHPPVVTLGRNSHHAHLLRPDEGEGEGGLEVFEVDLTGHRQDLHWYLRTLEQALIEALAALGVPAERKPGYTGVWTRGGTRKIASIGIHVKQWVTWHGFALNVTTDLSYFDRIVPCGIPGVVMTSVRRETGNGTRDTELWTETVGAVIRGFERAFGVTAKLPA